MILRLANVQLGGVLFDFAEIRQANARGGAPKLTEFEGNRTNFEGKRLLTFSTEGEGLRL